MRTLCQKFETLLKNTAVDFKRYLYDNIAWDSRLINQMCVENEVISSKKADFVIADYTFEVGGKSKQQKQIEKDGKSFVVKDDIEYGYQNVVPLWAFGFNY